MTKTFQVPADEMYRLMIHFAHSQMCVYSQHIKCNEWMSINDFRNSNYDMIRKIESDAKSLFNCDIASTQMTKAINAYIIARLNLRKVNIDKIFDITEP